MSRVATVENSSTLHASNGGLLSRPRPAIVLKVDGVGLVRQSTTQMTIKNLQGRFNRLRRLRQRTFSLGITVWQRECLRLAESQGVFRSAIVNSYRRYSYPWLTSSTTLHATQSLRIRHFSLNPNVFAAALQFSHPRLLTFWMKKGAIGRCAYRLAPDLSERRVTSQR